MANAAGPDPRAVELCRAAQAGHAREVEALIDLASVSANVRVGGLTPLMVACMADGHTPFGMDRSGHHRTQVVEVLLKANAEVDALGPGGWTPLFFAAFYAQGPCLQLLLDARADVMHKDMAGLTAATWIRKGQLDAELQRGMVRQLYAHGFPFPTQRQQAQGLVESDFTCPMLLDAKAQHTLRTSPPYPPPDTRRQSVRQGTASHTLPGAAGKK